VLYVTKPASSGNPRPIIFYKSEGLRRLSSRQKIYIIGPSYQPLGFQPPYFLVLLNTF
jgi:hypothetical protein